MFNKKRIVVFGVFFLFMFAFITFAGGTPQNQAIATRNVTFIDSYNNEELSSQRVIVGEDAVVPNDPSHDGYIFTGWYLSDDPNVRVTDFTNIISNLSVTARYGADANHNGILDDNETRYTVTFIDAISGAVLKTEEVLPGLSATAPTVPTYPNMTFTGWSTTYTNVRSNITVNTVYTTTITSIVTNPTTPGVEERYFNVTFIDSITNEIIEVVRVREGLTASTPREEIIPAHDQKLFTGWSGNYSNVTSDEEVYTIYVEDLNRDGRDDVTEERYTITFTDGNIDNIIKGNMTGTNKYENLLIGQNFQEINLTAPVVTATEHYTFNGFMNADENKAFDENGKVTGNENYTATYIPDKDEDGDGIADAVDTFIVNVLVENGTVNPENKEVKYEENAEFIVTPNENYTLNHAVVSEGCILDETTGLLTVNRVTKTTTCIVTLREKGVTDIAKEYEADVTLNVENGTPERTTNYVEIGENTTFTVEANENYNINDYTISEGCTLNGNTVTVENATKGMVCTLTFNLNKYNVTVTVENGTIDEETKEVTHGENREFIVTANEGYTLNNGVVSEGCILDEKSGLLTVNNVTESKTCTITLKEDKNNNGIADEKEITVKYNYIDTSNNLTSKEVIIEAGKTLGDKFFTPSNYSNVKADYTFINWTDKNNNIITEDTIINENTELKANYTESIKKFNVNFFTHENELIVENKEVEYGTKKEELNIPEIPTYEDHTFTGWVNNNGVNLDEITEVTENNDFTATYRAHITGLIVEAQKGELTYKVGASESELRNDLLVYTIDADGKKSDNPIDNYETSFNSNKAIEDGVELEIRYTNEAGKIITDNSLTYNITEGEVYDSDFDITYTPEKRSYLETERKNSLGITRICVNALAWDCDKGDRVKEKTTDFEFFELTQHISSYGITINSVIANYDNNTSETLVGYSDKDNDRVRWYMHRIINNRYFEGTYIIRKADKTDFRINGEGKISTVIVNYTNTRTNKNFSIKFRFNANNNTFEAEK